MQFNEIWTIDPTIRLGTLTETISTRHGNRWTCAKPLPLPRLNSRPFPGSDASRASHVPTMEFRQEWIINPQYVVADISGHVPFDHPVRLHGGDAYIEREVGAYHLSATIQTYAELHQKLTEIGHFLERSGWIAEDPWDVWLAYCEGHGRNPGPREYQPQTATSARRMWLALEPWSEVNDITENECSAIVERLAACCGGGQQALAREVSDCISTVRNIPAAQFVPVFGRMIYNPRPMFTPDAAPPSLGASIPASQLREPPVFVQPVAPVRGVVIHLVQPGKRAINLLNLE